MKPPKCKTCGAEEWKHTCGPRFEPKHISLKASVSPVTPALAKAVTAGNAAIQKTDRKEYLRLKARERRAAEREGLTLEAYRENLKKGGK